MSKQQIIESALRRSHKHWGIHLQGQEKLLFNIYIDAYSRITTQIAEISGKGGIPSTRLVLLREAIVKELKVLRRRTSTYILKNINYSIDASLIASVTAANTAQVSFKKHIGTSYFAHTGTLQKFNAHMETLVESSWARIHTQALDSVLKQRPYGLTLSKNVWDVTWQAQKQLLARVGSAVVTGESASSLARSVKDILGVSKVYRTVPLRETAPGVYKSTYKNALRLARTELARAYVEGQRQYIASKSWIKGVIHRIGSGNPCSICADLAGTFYSKDTYSQIPVHPHCMCYEEMVLQEGLI